MFRKNKFRHVWDFPGFSGWTAIFFGFLYVPIFVLVCYSFNSSSYAMIWTGFSFRWYEKLFFNDDILQAAYNSLIIAITAAPMATAIATISALVIVRGGGFRGKEFSSGLITLPLMVPEIVTAVATLIFFATLGINLGLINVIIVSLIEKFHSGIIGGITLHNHIKNELNNIPTGTIPIEDSNDD